jgi:hypothetical protein
MLQRTINLGTFDPARIATPVLEVTQLFGAGQGLASTWWGSAPPRVQSCSTRFRRPAERCCGRGNRDLHPTGERGTPAHSRQRPLAALTGTRPGWGPPGMTAKLADSDCDPNR